MIHKFKFDDKNIVIDVNSGAVHEFDDIAYECVSYVESLNNEEIITKFEDKFSVTEIEEVLEEINYLKKEGLLYSEDNYRSQLNLEDKKPIVKAMCLHISHDCNLRCKYCFASTGDFGTGRTMMTKEVGFDAIDLLIEKSGKRKNLEIDFFGGEPLMNFDVVKEIVEYAKEKEKKYGKKFNFTITTNGVLLNDDIIKYIDENMYNIVLSLDGRKEINDNMRKTINGKGSYDGIIDKIKKVAKMRGNKSHYVRGTFTRNNIDFSNDVLHLAEEGFKQISVEPVVAGSKSGLDLREEDLPKLFEEYEKLAREYVKRKNTENEFNFFHFMIDLSQGPCIAKRLGGCGSGHEYLAITPEGDIFPCHQFVGDEDFKMGNVRDGKLDSIKQNKFKNANVYTRKDCDKCWAKFYCSGGCAANSYQFNKDILSTYHVGCELERKRLECALWIQTCND